MFHQNTLFASFALTTLLAVPGLTQVADRGVRLSQQPTNIAYDVELVRGTQRAIVPVNYEFKTGDRFALRVKVASPSYVYVLNRTFNGPPEELRTNRQIRLINDGPASAAPGAPPTKPVSTSSGKPAPQGSPYTLVYPASGNRLLQPGTVNIIPAPGQLMEMDETPGVEKLILIVSPKPIDLTRYFDPATGKLRSRPTAAPAAPSGPRKDNPNDVLARLNGELSSMASNSEVAEADVPSRMIEWVPVKTNPGPSQPPKPEAPQKEAPKKDTARKDLPKPPAKPESHGAPKKPAEPFLVEVTLAHFPQA